MVRGREQGRRMVGQVWYRWGCTWKRSGWLPSSAWLELGTCSTDVWSWSQVGARLARVIAESSCTTCSSPIFIFPSCMYIVLIFSSHHHDHHHHYYRRALWETLHAYPGPRDDDSRSTMNVEAGADHPRNSVYRYHLQSCKSCSMPSEY